MFKIKSPPYYLNSVIVSSVLVFFFIIASLCTFISKIHAVPISSGIYFKQVDFTYPSATEINSPYGQVFLDYSQISGGGYINVLTSDDRWVVQNMPVFEGTGLPGLSMMFDLGYSGEESQSTGFEAVVDYTTVPLISSSEISGSSKPYGVLPHVEHNAQGGFESLTTAPANPSGKMKVKFDPEGKTTIPIINTIRSSVEQDHNQCGPAAVDNSLAYLDERYGVPLNHKHIPGIHGNPKDSMVGQIDVFVGPNGRKQGEGVWRSDLLDGKLKYLDKNGTKGQKGLIIKHQGVFDKEGKVVIDGDRTQGGMTSKYMGNLVTLDFLIKEINRGEDIEMDLSYRGKFGPGHEIMITGGGFIFGRPWVTFVHDANQGNNTAGTGLFDGGYGFAWLDDPGGGNFIKFKGYLIGEDGLAAGVRNVMTESIPEPSTYAMIVLGLMVLLISQRSLFKKFIKM